LSPIETLPVAIGAGAAALFLVAWMMRLLHSLKSEGTVHIERAVGKRGTVYLTIPSKKSGAGKVLLNLQDRTVEYQAVTSEDELATGSEVVVVGVVGGDIVEVAAAAGSGRS
jgi:membrane protein implicated in regulation of membrane protease activity